MGWKYGFRLYLGDEVHYVTDFEPRCAGWAGEELHLAIRFGVAVAGVVEGVVDHHAAVLNQRNTAVDFDVHVTKEFGGERAKLVEVAVVNGYRVSVT